MSVYFALIKKSFLQRIAYRVNSLMYIASTLLGLFISVSVWSALYSGRETVRGITLDDMLHFVIINALLAAFTASGIGARIGEKVEDGSISLDLIKPLSFKGHMIADQLGDNFYRFLFSALPAAAVIALVWNVGLPDSPQLAPFFAAMFGGIILMIYLNYIIGLVAFWAKTGYFVDFVRRAFFTLFAGTFVPLWFYPQALYTISQFLPFRYVVFDPVAIYLGKTTPEQTAAILALQWLWIALLYGLERLLWRLAQKQIDIHGG